MSILLLLLYSKMKFCCIFFLLPLFWYVSAAMEANISQCMSNYYDHVYTVYSMTTVNIWYYGKHMVNPALFAHFAIW